MHEVKASWADGLRPYVEKAPLAALFLGISSGFPFAMIGATLTTRLAESGIEKSAVTAFALTFLAYNLKWAWAPIVDKVRLPVLGRLGQRRSWLLVTGILVMIAVVRLGSIDPKSNLSAVVIAAICVGLAGATFDIVIDAYRIELLEPRQLGVGSGMSQYGWRIGSAAAGVLALVCADRFGWSAAYLFCALFALPAVLTGLIVGEPPMVIRREWPARMERLPYVIFVGAFVPALLTAAWLDRLLGVSILINMVLVGYVFPVFDLSARRARDAGLSSHLTWSWLLPIGGAVALFGFDVAEARYLLWAGPVIAIVFAMLPSRVGARQQIVAVGPLIEFFRRKGGGPIFLFVLIHKIGDTLANLTFRLLFNDLGFTKDEIAFYDVFIGFIALLVGIFIGGILYTRIGLKRSVLLSLFLMAISNAGFAILANLGHSSWGMASAIGFENFASGIGGVCVVAYLSALCNLKFTASQFALFSAAASILGRLISGTSAGALIERIGYADFYWMTTIVALPGVLLFWWMSRSGLVDASIGDAGTAGEGDARAGVTP